MLWYYKEPGSDDDSKTGPLSEAAFQQLAFEGKIAPSTLVMNDRHTNGEWVAAKTVPAYQQRRQQALDDAERRTDQERREEAMEQTSPPATGATNSQAPDEPTTQTKAEAPAPLKKSVWVEHEERSDRNRLLKRLGCGLTLVVVLVVIPLLTCGGIWQWWRGE